MKYVLILATTLLVAGCQGPDTPGSNQSTTGIAENATSSGINGVYYGGEGYYPNSGSRTDAKGGYYPGGAKGYNRATNGNFYDNPTYGKGVVGGPSAPAKDRVIYFGFDSAAIDPRSEAIIAAHAAYLKRHKSAKVVLEGHTDSRGSREYNIALGERRAQSVRQRFSRLGVSPAQMRLISYGEENPAVSGYSERAYQRNRRVVIQY